MDQALEMAEQLAVRLVTRVSTLALVQTAAVISAFGENARVAIIPTHSLGDIFRDRWEEYSGGSREVNKRKWIFELEEAVHSGFADVAIHCGKDIPDSYKEGTVLIPVLPRATPLDVLLMQQRPLAFSDDGFPLLSSTDVIRLGTGSLRRKAQLLRLFRERGLQGARVDPLRGNITTRLRRLIEYLPGEGYRFEGVVIAGAGMDRVELTAPYRYDLPVEVMVPAMNQGILVAQCRADDARTIALIRTLVDPITELEWAAERACVESLEVSCDTAFGVYAKVLPTASASVVIVEIHGRGLSNSGLQICEAISRNEVALGDSAGARAVGESLADTLRAQGIYEVIGKE